MTWPAHLPYIHLDPGSGVPIYRQIVDQVQAYAAAGVLRPGDQLPSIRVLAHAVGVNPTTVVKAYTELEHAGAIERQHGRGVFLAGPVTVDPPSAARAMLLPLARRLAVDAARLGVPAGQVRAILDEALAELERAAAEIEEAASETSRATQNQQEVVK